jgi:putative FmdB family regulatory protein
MPLYDFECTPCAYYTEITQSMQDPSVLECPVCGQPTLQKIYINPPQMFVRGEAKTVRQLAERNYKDMGFYEKSDKLAQDSQNGMTKEQTEKRKLHQKITSMTPEQKVKWIKNGDK